MSEITRVGVDSVVHAIAPIVRSFVGKDQAAAKKIETAWTTRKFGIVAVGGMGNIGE